MKRRHWLTLGLLTTVLTVGSVAAVHAADDAAPSSPHARWADRPLGRLLMGRLGRAMALRSDLDLTPDQKQAIATTLKAHKAEIATALQPVVEKGRALRAATEATEIDEAKIHTLAADLGNSIGDAAVVAAKVRADVKQAAHLTDEQAKKIADFHAANQAATDKFLSDLAKQ